MEKLKWVSEQRLKDSWDGTNLSFEKDRAYGFSWPQRNYRCSFCKKEFKSAQALGGHMNVHRRDRARMRLSPSWDHHHNLHSANPIPNPNTFSSSSTAKVLPNYNTASLQEKKVSDNQNNMAGNKMKVGSAAMIEFSSNFATKKDDSRVWKANHEFVRLDLNLSLVHDAKEDLDLELRLGYSN